MTDQRTDAAERSAHVSRGAAQREWRSPCVEVAPGQWRLRALVEAEARIAALKSALDAAAVGLASIERHAYRRGAEAMREAAAQCVEGITRPEDWFMAPVAARIRALPLPEGGE